MAVEFGAKLYLKDNMYANSVKIDDLVLNAEDLYIADYLVAGYTRQIKVPYVSGVSVDTTQSNGFASKDNPDPDTRVWKQSQITYTDGLKAGDMVLVQKLNDNNKYVIIARVVEARCFIVINHISI